MNFKAWFKRLLLLFWRENQDDINEKVTDLKEKVEARLKKEREDFCKKIGYESARPNSDD